MGSSRASRASERTERDRNAREAAARALKVTDGSEPETTTQPTPATPQATPRNTSVKPAPRPPARAATTEKHPDAGKILENGAQIGNDGKVRAHYCISCGWDLRRWQLKLECQVLPACEKRQAKNVAAGLLPNGKPKPGADGNTPAGEAPTPAAEVTPAEEAKTADGPKPAAARPRASKAVVKPAGPESAASIAAAVAAAADAVTNAAGKATAGV